MPEFLRTAEVPTDELIILRAKAEVCDAYRDWLQMPRGPERAVVGDALAKLQRLEAALSAPPRVSARSGDGGSHG